MPESDIWALGASLYELITGDAPFGNDGGNCQVKGSNIPPIKQDVPDSIKELVYSCLSYEPEDRPSARSIVDIVLKKRYRRNKKTIVFISILGVLVVAGLTAFLISRNASDPEEHLNVMVARGDSIINLQIAGIQIEDRIDAKTNIEEFEKAIILYNNVIKDASPEFAPKQSVVQKVKITTEIISELKEYERARDLAEKARLCEMEDEFVQYSVIKENHKSYINRLIQKLK